MLLLGFGYQAGVGKDTICDYLVSKGGWVKKSFAENLKECSSYVFDLPIEYFYDYSLKNKKFDVCIPFTFAYFSSIILWMNSSIEGSCIPRDYKVFKKHIHRIFYSPRDILQFVGTEIVRALLPEYHVTTCFSNLDKDTNYAICDVRFPNEGDALLKRGGFCIEVVGDSVLSTDSNKVHASEVSMSNWGKWFSSIYNNKEEGFEVLYNKIDKLLEDIENVNGRR